MEGLSFENILGEQDMDTLFVEPEDTYEKNSDDGSKGTEDVDSSKEKKEEKLETEEKTTETINPDDLFDEGEGSKSESVGSGNNSGGQEDTFTGKGDGASPNFYSSIAKALAVDSVFLNLDEETVSKVDSAESLGEIIDKEVNARVESQFNEGQKRVLEALNNGVEPSEIRKYEGTLNYISSITDADIAEESEKGEQLRRTLIMQDFINRGMTQEKARKLTERAIDAGTDVEDAKEALQSNREFFAGRYNALLQEAQLEAEADKAERMKQSEKLKESIMKDKDLMGDVEISDNLRKKTFENITRPVYRDPDSGEYLTALQKYEMEHRADFLKYVGLTFTLTNGFKDFDSFTKGKVKKEVRAGLRELEKTLNNTRRDANGSLRMVTNVKEDPESFINGNFKLAL